VSLTPPARVELIRVRTGAEMYDAVLDRMPEATILIKAAAVADYRAKNIAEHKVKKQGDDITLHLEPNPDILAELGRIKGDRLLIGFAAETENLVDEARRKLEKKNCDMMVANLVGREGTGFDSVDNEVVMVLRNGDTIPLEKMPKRQIAERILDRVLTLTRAVHAAK
jgi:phosphopantothenoylcysteine decarboxylase / phosphopantothenate---cysteine ligase